MKKVILLFLLTPLFTYSQNPYILILGVAQDGGYPQANCQKSCCKKVYAYKVRPQFVTSIALIDPISKEKWIFEATPNFPQQLQLLVQHTSSELLTGIFITHAHIGHYTGLMHLGREVIGAKKMKVFTMPKMKEFLEKMDLGIS